MKKVTLDGLEKEKWILSFSWVTETLMRLMELLERKIMNSLYMTLEWADSWILICVELFWFPDQTERVNAGFEITWLIPDHLNKTGLVPTCSKVYWLPAPADITMYPQIDIIFFLIWIN